MGKLGENIMYAAIAVVVIWAVFLINLILPWDLRLLGLQPRTLSGLWGLLFTPFLHASFRHLIANSSALFFLLLLALSVDRALTVKAVVVIMLVGGGAVWLLGRSQTIHIGASGVIFGLIGFLLFAGLFLRQWKAWAASLIVLFFYSYVLLAGLAPAPGVSWTGHAFGFGAGVLAAWVLGAPKGDRVERSA